MIISDIKKFICKKDIPLIDAIKKIDQDAKGILFVVDDDNKLIGSITDGDIRRELIKNSDVNISIKNIYNKNPKYIYKNENIDVYKKMIDYKITAMPILDKNNEIIDIYFINDNDKHLIKNSTGLLKDIPVIIMAGGKGTRLYPYTKILPKPLIPINGIPILERIIDKFRIYDVENFYITVNYKKNMIMSYFNEFEKNYNIQYVEEEKPLGTAGSISLINREFSEPIFVTNCDILIDVNYESLYAYHLEYKNDVTIVGSLKNITVPYGVLDVENDGVVVGMKEKPSMSYFINTGMYVVSPEALEYIPKNEVYNMPDLAKNVINNCGRVGMYPISEESFLDMGEFSEMQRMEEKLAKQ